MKQTKEVQSNLFENTPNRFNEINKLNRFDDSYYKKLLPLKVTPVYNTYWIFAEKRQNIFIRKKEGCCYPWTEDPILQKYKFTNTYRASDRVSQYLIRNVIYSGNFDSIDTFFRIILFKLFNKIETWELLENKVGQITYHNYDFAKYDRILEEAISNGTRIYSAAYIMAPGKIDKRLNRKHSNHLKLLEMMIADNAHGKIAAAINFQGVYDILISYPLIGKFLGYQYAIDLNYSEIINFSENEFVIPGPGALSGISKCFESTGGLTEIEIIKFMEKRQHIEFDRLGLEFSYLNGRKLTLIDCQNIFCEVDKYSRLAHPKIKGRGNRNRIKQVYKPSNRENISYYYPQKWGINESV